MEKFWSRSETGGETYLNQSVTLRFQTPCEEAFGPPNLPKTPSQEEIRKGKATVDGNQKCGEPPGMYEIQKNNRHSPYQLVVL